MALRPGLEASDGVVSVERFRSLTDPDKLLSLSFWRDEEAVAQWRRVEAHRDAQTAGRETVFQDYRLRIAAYRYRIGSLWSRASSMSFNN